MPARDDRIVYTAAINGRRSGRTRSKYVGRGELGPATIAQLLYPRHRGQCGFTDNEQTRTEPNEGLNRNGQQDFRHKLSPSSHLQTRHHKHAFLGSTQRRSSKNHRKRARRASLNTSRAEEMADSNRAADARHRASTRDTVAEGEGTYRTQTAQSHCRCSHRP